MSTSLSKRPPRVSKFSGDSIRGLWRRSESLADRAFDYKVSGETLQSAGTGSKDLIEAKLHVAYADN